MIIYIRCLTGSRAVVKFTHVMCVMTKRKTMKWRWLIGWFVDTAVKNRWVIRSAIWFVLHHWYNVYVIVMLFCFTELFFNFINWNVWVYTGTKHTSNPWCFFFFFWIWITILGRYYRLCMTEQFLTKFKLCWISTCWLNLKFRSDLGFTLKWFIH